VEKPLTTIEEVHQEKPAPRETQPEPGEVAPELEVMTSGEETATESGANTNDEPVASEEAVELEAELAGEGDGEAESEEPTVPALPPLGQAGGMVGFFPRSPSYPKGAQHLGVEGRVLVEFYLTPEGTYLKEPLILVPSGHRVLDEHCQQIITKGEWRFKPAAQPYKLQVEIGYANNEVTIEFLGEAAYLSTEEGGELIEQ
jgi:TonB family protein